MMVMAPSTNVALATPGTAPANGVVFNAKSAVALVNERRIEFVRARNVRVLGSVNDDSNGVSSSSASSTTRPKTKVLVEPHAIERLLSWQHARKIGPGFANLGNTCYLNSVLQCLAYTPAFAQYLLEKDVVAQFASSSSNAATTTTTFHKHHSSSSSSQYNVSNKTAASHGFCSVRVLCRLLQTVHSSSSPNRVVQPKDVVMNIRHISKRFRIGRQEDAHEFFRLLLDTMQRACLRRAHIKSETHPAASTTLIHRLFRGDLLSSLQCRKCDFVSERRDAFFDLSLEIGSGLCDIASALRHFTATETLDQANAWTCTRCKQPSRALKGLKVAACPNILVIQLKRFDAMDGKIKKHVAFDIALDVAPFMARTTDGAKRTCTLYELSAVLVHAGYSTDCGHYYAFVRGANSQWYEMNDDSVRWVRVETVLQQKAYMLFYSRVVPAKERLRAQENEREREKATAAAVVGGGGIRTNEQTPIDTNERASVKTLVVSKEPVPPEPVRIDMHNFLTRLKTTITRANESDEQEKEKEKETAAQATEVFHVTSTSKRASGVVAFSGRIGRIGRFQQQPAAAAHAACTQLELTRETLVAAKPIASKASKATTRLTVEDVVAATTTAAMVALPLQAQPPVPKVHFDVRKLQNIGVKSAALFGKTIDKWNETSGWRDEQPTVLETTEHVASALDDKLAAQHDRVMSKLKSEDWKHRNAARQDQWDATLDAGHVKKVKKRKDFVANQGAANKFQLQLQHSKKQRRV